MFRKVFILVLLVVACLAALTLSFLMSPKVSRRIIPVIAHNQIPALTIKKLVIGKQLFVFPKRLTFENVKATVVIGGDQYEVKFKLLDVALERIFSSSSRKTILSIQEGRIFSEIMDMDVVNVKGGMTGQSPFHGVFSVEVAQWLGYAASRVNGEFTSGPGSLVIKPLTAGLYGGRLNAEIVLAYLKSVTYSINAKVEKVDIKQLESINPELFSNMKGRIDGDLDIRGDVAGITYIGGSIWTGPGGEIKAVLLKPFLDYIPQSTQKRDLDLLIKDQKNIPLDSAVVKIIDAQDDKLATRIDLESKKFNLDVGLSLDFNIEGGMRNLIKLQEQLFRQGR